MNCGAILEWPRMSCGSLWESHNDPPKWRAIFGVVRRTLFELHIVVGWIAHSFRFQKMYTFMGMSLTIAVVRESPMHGNGKLNH